MKDLLFNVNSVEVSYGDDVLNSIILIEERIDDLGLSVSHYKSITDFEEKEWNDRIDKLIVLNTKIQEALERQAGKLNGFRSGLAQKAILQH